MNLKSASRYQVLRYCAMEHVGFPRALRGPPCQLWLKCINNTRRSVSTLLRRQTIPSSVLCCSSSHVSGGRTRKHCCALRKARRVVHLPRCGVTSVEWGQSALRRIVRAAGDAKDHERVVFTFVPTHQDGTAISAFAFDRRIKRFQHWRRPGHRFNERRRNDLEGPLWEGEHCCTSSKFGAQHNFQQLPI